MAIFFYTRFNISSKRKFREKQKFLLLQRNWQLEGVFFRN